MRCEDAAIFVSALHDGERVPHGVAEHLGTCETCAAQMAAYSAIGAELRRIASLDESLHLQGGLWEKRQGVRSNWWRKGREPMRIPRFAFASMMAAILLLSGGLVIVRARSSPVASVLWLAMKLPPDGQVIQSALATDGQPGSDAVRRFSNVSGGMLYTGVRFLRREGDRVQLGVTAKYQNPAPHIILPAEWQKGAEQTLWIEPGTKAEISVAGLGIIEFAGDFIDHKPPAFFSPDDTIDPPSNQFRIVSPVLLRGKEVLFNFRGASTWGSNHDGGVYIYWPGEGRFLFSAAPFKDAVKASVSDSQVEFSAEGQDYVLLSAVPITRAANLWIRHEPSYKPSENKPGMTDDTGMLGAANPGDFPKE